MPICLDDATKNRSFGHFARVLLHIDLKGSLHGQIMYNKGISIRPVPCSCIIKELASKVT